jgi:hypothetical protein
MGSTTRLSIFLYSLEIVTSIMIKTKWRLLKILGPVVLIMIISRGCTPEMQTRVFSDQWDTLRVLNNPYKGWYHHLLDNGIEKYPISNDAMFDTFPGMDHLYLRLAWSFLEPREGEFNWKYIDDVVEKYVPRGYGISFRISTKETGSYPGVVGHQKNGVQYATPTWVEQAGAKGTVTTAWGTRSWTPVWNDKVFLEKLDNFHKVFAQRYDHQPWVRYVDIGSIGEWGEGHTHFSTQIPPSVEEVKANTDIFLKHYKNSLLVATDDLLYYGKSAEDQQILLDYIVSNGISLRDDSPLVDWYLENNLDTWSVSHPHFFQQVYLNKPVIFELQHYHMVKSDGNWIGKNGSDIIGKFGYSGADIFRNAMKTMGATYIGYHGYLEEWLVDNPYLTRELANICGYWYFPVSTRLPSSLSKGNNTIGLTWLNKGVAPAYKTFGLIFRLQPASGGNPVDIMIEDSGNLDFLPLQQTEKEYFLNVANEVSRGEYLLKLKMMDISDRGTQDIHLGLEEQLLDQENFFTLGVIRIK